MSTELTTGANPLEFRAKTRNSWLYFAPRGIAALTLLWLLTRWVVERYWNLVPDEAYYWVWSQHPALSYFDHPPIVAYLIRIGTAILGNTELGVRWPFGVMIAGSALILWIAGRQIIAEPRAAGFIPLALLVSPMVAVAGTIAAPDAPACFFPSAALAAVLGIFSGKERIGSRWLLFGILMGLALDSKYTSVLLGLAVALAMISCPEGRRQLVTPWPWLGVIAAGIVFSPVIYWNASHHWESFLFQLHHGTSESGTPAWKNVGDYALGQIAVCTPILLGVCIAAIWIYWKRSDNPMTVRILWWSAITPLAFFAISATRHHVEGNWPMFAYFPAIVLFARYLGEGGGRQRIFWGELAVIVAACMTIVLHLPNLAWQISPKLGSPQWDHLYGWRQLAEREVEPLRGDSPVFTADYEYASELLFYLPDGADVRPLSDPTRPTAFDFFGDQSSPTSFDRVVLVRRLPKGYDAPPPWLVLGPAYDYTILKVSSQIEQGRQIRRTLIEVAERKAK
jgi:hypothetical protein